MRSVTATAPGGPARLLRVPARLLARAWFPVTVLGLLAFNAWWYRADRRPVPELAQVRAQVARREFSAAEAALAEILRRSPRSDEAWMLLGRCRANRGDLRGCAEALRRVPYWSPRKGEALYLEGTSWFQAGLARPAEAAWWACIRDDPLHPTPPAHHKNATEQLIELFANQGRWADAQEAVWVTYERAGPSDHPNVMIMWLRTEIQRIGDEQAARFLRRLVAADPDDITSRRALAVRAQALGDAAEADRQIAQCLERAPADPQVWRDRLLILRARGDEAGLRAVIDQLPAGAEKLPEVWTIRGHVRERAGDLEGARAAYERAIAGDPGNAESHYRLALIENRLGRRDPAREHLARSKEINEARNRLVDAFDAYVRATEPGADDPAALAKAAEDLAGICRVLGWTRAAEAIAATGRAAG